MTVPISLESVLQTAKTETEILFALENPALCIAGLKEGMKQFLNQDETVLEVKKQLDLPDEFYRINKDTVWKFFLSGNGKYVRAYMHSSVRRLSKWWSKPPCVIVWMSCGIRIWTKNAV